MILDASGFDLMLRQHAASLKLLLYAFLISILKVEFEDEDDFQFVFPASPQLLKEGLYCSERRPLFRGVAREKA
jgi:hypothetical protein